MQRPSLDIHFSAIVFAAGSLLLSIGVVTGAHAQEPVAQTPASVSQPAVFTASTAAAAVSVADSSAQPAQAAMRDRELIRAHRMERRMMISESTGIPLGELDDLLRKIRPTAEERNNDERRTQTGRLSVEDLDENP